MEDAAPYTTAAHMRQLAERMDAERNELTSNASLSYFRACAPMNLLPLLSQLEAQLAAAETAAAALLARATKAEAKAAGLLQELGDQEVLKMELVREGLAHQKTLQKANLIIGQLLDTGQKLAAELASRVGFEWPAPLAPPASAPVAPVAGVAAGTPDIATPYTPDNG